LDTISSKSERVKVDAVSSLGVACTNTFERIAASLGKLSLVSINFQSNNDINSGGVLFALPALLSNGLLEMKDKFFKLPKGYYDLRSILIILSFLVLLRVKSLENIRYLSPGELGRLVGLDRIPEVKTLREKLNYLSENGKVKEWKSYLSRRWMEDHPDLSGYLYIDGHVRVYHGKQTKLPKRFVSRERLCLRGMTDYWVNDMYGQPFFVINKTISGGILSVIREDIVPRLSADVPNQPSEEELLKNKRLHKFTLVFDREGYSPDFFKEMFDLNIACITYKKYPSKDWNKSEFRLETEILKNGERVEMQIAERGICFKNKLWVREIRKLSKDGHQTSIITTEFESNYARIALVMFARWSQENFFKYMMSHYGIDRLVEYKTEEINDTILLVNPEYRKLDSQIKSQNSKLSRKIKEFGLISLKNITDEKKVKDFEKEKAEIQENIAYMKIEIKKLKDKRKQHKKHIPFKDLPENEKFSKLYDKKKQFMDTIKMIAYRAETALVNTIRPKMSKKDDARSFIRKILSSEIDVKTDKKNKKLIVSLHNLANRVSDHLAQEICNNLNETETIFPGTDLKIFYKMVSD